MITELLPAVLMGFASVAALFLFIWIIHLLIKNAAIVDVGWGIGFIVLGFIYIVLGEGFNLRNMLLLGMVMFWGLRIALFLVKRIIGEGHEDRRYQKLRQEWGKYIPLKFLFFFEFQALLQVIVALPLLLVSINPSPGISLVEILGFLIFGIGLWGETVADEQLRAFKANPSNKGKTCQVGFWKYSRHPNYFFEWVIWMGIFIYALPSPMGWISVISPALMYYLMMYVSGVPLAERQALVSRGEEYRKYQESTSMFFPMPRKV